MPKIIKTPLCPATKWVVSTADAHRVVVLQFDFVTTPTEDVLMTDHSPHFVLSADDARALGSTLQDAAHDVDATDRRRVQRTVQ